MLRYGLSTATSCVSAPGVARKRTSHRTAYRVSTVRLVSFSDQQSHLFSRMSSCRCKAIESSASSPAESSASFEKVGEVVEDKVDSNAKKSAPAKKDALEQMRVFSERYAKNSNTYFCSDPGVTAVVIKVREKERKKEREREREA